MLKSTIVSTSYSGARPAVGEVTPGLHYTWVDTAKGIGIILVVIAHVIRGLITSHIIIWTPTIRFVDAWIYAFHMPLFFFLTGLFLFRSTSKPWPIFAADKIRTIAYPYFVWSTITLLLKIGLGNKVNWQYDLSSFPLLFYHPIDQFWFLYVLFILVIAISGLLKLGTKAWAIFSLTVIAYFLPISNPLHVVGEIRDMAIYLALAVLLGSEPHIRMISAIKVGFLSPVLLCGLLVSSLAAWSHFAAEPLFRFTFALSGILAVLCIALLMDKLKHGNVLQFFGRYSLEIYVAHTIASAGVRIILVNFLHVFAPAAHFVLGTLAGLLAPIGLALLFEFSGFQYGFRIPRARDPS